MELRWAKLRRSGASNEQLKAALGSELGRGGSSCGPGMIDEAHKGGAAPSVILGEGSEKVELSGAALLGAVRATLLIPMPKDLSENYFPVFLGARV